LLSDGSPEGRGGDFNRKALAEGSPPSMMRFAGSGVS
jgi:hypothetical protein